ncbi:DUF2142 domain-containing protein [Achromobacter ruhlandii]|nr:DUF2142 domain-containing protein [Achromobacter ruhlandii]MCV6794484.1 DUF2142 domain-containing protein [Achromobacter ruhlandii]MCV6800727.1 DUF2142 domain-containing protein [Achromobacter ruhlandii]MCV6808551.1 DUF2142 domain-containing protein [Achromobacter ruhlandii]MCV6817379.1 DUF2142 domain-containing protein [Achromobacter ruhlandii]MCZ8394969.1 DUF2142 domain-containing protein [Achromobacter ruhlandii]
MVLNRLVPPMQSPDEPVHILRAYLLTDGVVFLKNQEGKMSGGMIDRSLIDFAMTGQGPLPGNLSAKVTSQRVENLSSMTWSGDKVFFELPTTSYYFPAIYLPQAVGLAIGESLHLSIQQSYYLARYSAFLASVAVILLAVRVFPINPLTVCLLIIPMSVFQFMGAGMDGFSLALTILAVSIFMRLSQEKDDLDRSWSYLLIALIFVLATSRIQIASFVLMPFALALTRRKSLYLWQGLIVTALVLTWLYISIAGNQDGGLHHAGYSHLDVIKHYLAHPAELIRIIYDTVSHPYNQKAYAQQFVGVLGWLDTKFPTGFYNVVGWMFVLVAVLSVSLANIKHDWVPRLALLVMFLGACFTIYFALLVQWNKFPTTMINGVQGRYFTVPLVALAYALSGDRGFKTPAAKASTVVLAVIAALTFTKMPQLLLDRFYIG